MRQYALDRLGESGEAEADAGAAASWFLGLAAEAGPQLQGPEAASWLGRLEREHDNLRALAFLGINSRRSVGRMALAVESGLRLAGALWRFWLVRGQGFDRGPSVAGAGLGADRRGFRGTAWRESRGGAGHSGTSARAKALNGAGNLAWAQADHAGAQALFEESLTLARESGDQRGTAHALGNLGNVAYNQGDYAEAREAVRGGPDDLAARSGTSRASPTRWATWATWPGRSLTTWGRRPCTRRA